MGENKEHNRTKSSPANGNRTPVVLTLLFFLLVGVGYLGARHWLGESSLSANQSNKSSSVAKELIAEIDPMVDLKEFLVNIISEDNSHYLKTSMTIQVSDAGAQEELIQRMPQVRDAILLLISNKTFEELYDLHGKKQLKAEIKLTIDSLMITGEVTAVYLTDFIVQ